MDALGYKNPIYTIAHELEPVYLQAQQTDGQPGAIRAIQAAAPQLCAALNNPVLSSAQVSQLAALAASGDAAKLQQISYFGTDGGSQPTVSGPIADPVRTCAVENIAEFDVLMADNGSNQRLGRRMAQSGFAGDLLLDFQEHRVQDGDSGAIDYVKSQATQLCSAKSPAPVLTQQDVSDLMSIAPSDDVASLQQITDFGYPASVDSAPASIPEQSSPASIDTGSGDSSATAPTSSVAPAAAVSTVAAASDANVNRDPAIDGPATAGTPADLSAFQNHASDIVASFTSPSGNITCSMYVDYPAYGDKAVCGIFQHQYQSPLGLTGGSCGTGDYVEVSDAQGARAPAVCTVGPVSRGVALLPFGQSLTLDKMTCLSTKSGVKCQASDGRGFVISQREIILYN